MAQEFMKPRKPLFGTEGTLSTGPAEMESAGEEGGDETSSLSEALRDGDGEDDVGEMIPPESLPSTLPAAGAIADRKSYTQKINDVIRAVQNMKFGKTPEERAAGTKAAMDRIQTDADAYQRAELNRKDENGVSIMDQISQAKRKLEELEDERRGTVQANQWGQIAEQLGNAITQTFAGMYGLRHNVNLSGLKFDRANWEERLRILLGDVNDRMDRATKEQIQGQQLSQKVGETAFRTAAKAKQKVLSDDAREQAAAEAQRKATLEAAVQAAGKEADLEARRDEGAKNRQAALERAREIQRMIFERQNAKELNRVNEKRAEVGLEPLTSLSKPGVTPATEKVPTQELATPTSPTAAPAMGKEEGETEKVIEEIEPLAFEGKTYQPLIAGLGRKVPNTLVERKAYFNNLGKAKAQYYKEGGDAKANESYRQLMMVAAELRNPSSANLSGTAKDKFAAVARPFNLWGSGIGEMVEVASELDRPRLTEIKEQMEQAALPGLKVTFGGNISDAEGNRMVRGIWNSRLSPGANADKIERVAKNVLATRNALSDNPQENVKFDAETAKMVEKIRTAPPKAEVPAETSSKKSTKSLLDYLREGPAKSDGMQ